MFEIAKKDVIVPGVGQLSTIRKAAIRDAKDPNFIGLVAILRACGKLEVYRGTTATKQGYFVQTFDPSHSRKRPNIPQWKFL